MTQAITNPIGFHLVSSSKFFRACAISVSPNFTRKTCQPSGNAAFNGFILSVERLERENMAEVNFRNFNIKSEIISRIYCTKQNCTSCTFYLIIYLY